MGNAILYKDYGWKAPETCAHKYLCETLKKVLEKFNIERNKNILDAGCGGGYIINWLNESGYKNIWGFDLSLSGIEVAKKTNNDFGGRFAEHNAYEKSLPTDFPENNYDIVISTEVIEHLYSPSTYMKNINFWLKKGGYLILTTPYHGYLKNLAIALMNKFDWHASVLDEGGDIKFFSKNTLYKLLGQSGFSPVQFYGSGRLPFLWKSMVVIAEKL